jgi:anthranilate phosphoribosyltransferase
MPLRALLDRVLAGEHLSRGQARTAMDAIMGGDCEPAQVGALLAGLRAKGETGDELAGMAGSMRAHVLRVKAPPGPLIDTCGTGGDGAQTINISTAAALVAAAGGAVVAKHGNRSISSRCGSADVLEALGVRVDLDVPRVEACLRSCGIGFLFAPSHHPAMRNVMPVRRAMGVRTAFNLLGPMTNPAGARRQVIGVFAPRYAEVMARALAELGSEHVLVVCGDDGEGGVLDEVSTCASTLAWELRDGKVQRLEISPEQLGISPAPVSALRGGDAAQNAAALESILGGEPGPRGDAVAANAGAALYVAGLAEDLRDGVEQAQKLLAEGAGLATLEALRKASS